MMRTTLRRLFLLEPGRTSLSIMAVAAAVVLVLVLEGFRVGIYRQVREYLDALPAQLILTQAGVKNMTAARSVIPVPTMWAVKGVPGVRAVHPLGGMPIMYDGGERKTPVYLIAHGAVGGPPEIVVGRVAAGPGEIVVDAGLARIYDLTVGDPFELFGQGLVISGLAGGSSSMFNPFLYITVQGALELLSKADLPESATNSRAPSFILVETEPGASPLAVGAAIESSLSSVDVFTPSRLADNDVEMARDMMGPVMNLLVGVAWVVGMLIVGLTVYTAVLERSRELGIMKALGARDAYLNMQVIAEVVWILGLGFAVGVLAAGAVARLITDMAPQYLVVPWAPGVLARGLAALAAMALTASLVPLRQIARVDPVVVFQE